MNILGEFSYWIEAVIDHLGENTEKVAQDKRVASKVRKKARGISFSINKENREAKTNVS